MGPARTKILLAIAAAAALGAAAFAVAPSGALASPGAGSLRFSAAAADPSSVTLPNAVVGQAYSATIEVSGGMPPYTWSVTSGSLPNGLSLGTSNGQISGTPTQAGTSQFTIQAVDSSSPPEVATVQLTLSVLPQSGTLPDAVLGEAYLATLQASGGTAPYTWSVTGGSLPSGLALGSSTGWITGTPTQVETSQFTVQAVDSSSTPRVTTLQLSLTVLPSSEVTTGSLADAAVGDPYLTTLEASGGQPPYTWSITNGSLPSGLTLGRANGQISGTPTQAGTSQFTIQAVDSASPPNVATLELSLAVDKGDQLITFTKVPPSNTSLGASYPLAATGGASGAPVVLSIDSSSTAGVCSVSQSSVTFSGAGTCVIDANQAGNANYNAAPQAQLRITVHGASSPPTGHGYWLVGGDGGIFTFGSAHFFGSTGNLALQRPVVGITPTADQGGYWLVASDGGVFSFGDAPFVGSIPELGIGPAGSGGPGRTLSAPIVGMVPSADDGGYFMVGSDGGVFAFGDARYEGSCPGLGGCDGPAVAVVPDRSGNGYWLVTSVGSVYAFGDAPYLGALPAQSVPVVSAQRTPDGLGYWILFANGEVASFGDAANLGSLASGATNTVNPAAAIFATSDGAGYWIATANGTVYAFGDAPNDGGMNGAALNAPIIAATGF